jgi:hemerythrin-like domain-containing protein
VPTLRKGAAARWSVAFEHRRLGALFSRMHEALKRQGEDRASARKAMLCLSEAMEAHLGQEESLYYPTIWALRPDYKEPLRELLDIHPRIRDRMAALAKALDAEAGCERGGRAEVMGQLEGLDQLFQQHESAEEQLLHSLDLGPEH